VLNCTYPASVVGGVTETSPRIIDMLLKTLSQAVPQRVVAQSNDAACSGIFSGEDPDQGRVRSLRRKNVQHIDPHAGGYGARPMRDGVNAIRVLVGNAGIQSIELIENMVPLRVESWHLVPDSGGAGRWRGGLTSERLYTVGYDEATLSVIAERGIVAPDGLFGGLAGGTFKSVVERSDGNRVAVPSKGEYLVVHRGDRVSIRPAAGGGYGDPLEREAERVLEDVRDGYVSAEAAASLYGVVIDAAGPGIDRAATDKRRRAMRDGVLRQAG
jgi:N-methylhydantoinase B